MAVRIRLSRIGKKHVPFFRIVAVDSRQKRDGEYLDNIGTYDTTKSIIITFNEERYNHWISQGALPTDSAKKIFKQYKRTGIAAAVVQAKPEQAAQKVAKTVEEKSKAKAVVKKAAKDSDQEDKA